jgi:glycosyltransferase involved in cell wall biosynthesis
MRVTFISKRFPQQRDLVERPYGRFHHLPAGLAALGHEVQLLVVSHHGLPSSTGTSHGIAWASEDLRRRGPFGLKAALLEHARGFSPDWVIGCSDIHFGLLARSVARRLDARLGIDAYDDYESYMPWNLPMHWLWRRAIRDADLVTAAGPQLAALLQSHRDPADSRAAVVPMAADPHFAPRPSAECRRELGLAGDVPLLGYLGSWGAQRGTDILVPALRAIRRQRPEARLVTSGRPPARVVAEPGVIALGHVDDDAMPALLNSLDVACVITADSRFGRYSYPAKLCEAMACRVPVVATATDPVRWMLSGDEGRMVPIGDADALAGSVLRSLGEGKATYPPLAGWPEASRTLSDLLGQQATRRS